MGTVGAQLASRFVSWWCDYALGGVPKGCGRLLCPVDDVMAMLVWPLGAKRAPLSLLASHITTILLYFTLNVVHMTICAPCNHR